MEDINSSTGKRKRGNKDTKKYKLSKRRNSVFAFINNIKLVPGAKVESNENSMAFSTPTEPKPEVQPIETKKAEVPPFSTAASFRTTKSKLPPPEIKPNFYNPNYSASITLPIPKANHDSIQEQAKQVNILPIERNVASFMPQTPTNMIQSFSFIPSQPTPRPTTHIPVPISVDPTQSIPHNPSLNSSPTALFNVLVPMAYAELIRSGASHSEAAALLMNPSSASQYIWNVLNKYQRPSNFQQNPVPNIPTPQLPSENTAPFVKPNPPRRRNGIAIYNGESLKELAKEAPKEPPKEKEQKPTVIEKVDAPPPNRKDSLDFLMLRKESFDWDPFKKDLSLELLKENEQEAPKRKNSMDIQNLINSIDATKKNEENAPKESDSNNNSNLFKNDSFTELAAFLSSRKDSVDVSSLLDFLGPRRLSVDLARGSVDFSALDLERKNSFSVYFNNNEP